MLIEIAYLVASGLSLIATTIVYLRTHKKDIDMIELTAKPTPVIKKTLTMADKIYILLENHSFKGALQNIHTPRALINEILDKVAINPTAKVLVLFNLEFVVSLVYDYNIPTANITFYSDHDEKTQFANQLQVNTITDLTEHTMKFDVVIGNPPYQGKAALHQQFFNKSVDLLIDNGVVVFIQPATPYFNKKAKKKAPEQKMIDNINQYHTEVKVVSGDVFDNADIGTELAITYLTKTESDQFIQSIEYKNGDVYHNVDINDISMTKLNPDIYKSIRNKFLSFIDNNGSLYDIETTDINVFKASMTKVRGHTGKEDFFTFIPRISNRHKCKCDDNYTNFGVIAKDQQEVNHIFDYLESYVARMGLALSKFCTQQHMGELKTVPLVDFSKTYTDQQLFDMIGLNETEITAIKSVISNYYNR
jgi:hypothetical protein